ncbi:MAG: hypothetical protein CME64_07220 [Halobacteriovoraceae bacterium]|nr:hypothetical protein [Halobacteriovoraceae bacterium]|tara:strand:+ start:62171 stop:62557 length:387 start_codon:yes stop_codon:yes gene_type:complete
MGKGNDYISQMVLETLNEASGNVIEFRKPSNQMELNFNTHHVDYSKERGCFEFACGGQVLEIPSSWGPFKTLNYDQSNFDLRISKEDPSMILTVLSALLEQDLDHMHIFGPKDDLRLTFEYQESRAAA